MVQPPCGDEVSAVKTAATSAATADPFPQAAMVTASTAYGTIGKGMHADLPGHSFVLIDKAGNQRWYGEYPSMSLSTADLLKEVRSHLTS